MELSKQELAYVLKNGIKEDCITCQNSTETAGIYDFNCQWFTACCMRPDENYDYWIWDRNIDHK